jgi:electron transfer flavoprotein alpha subunit
MTILVIAEHDHRCLNAVTRSAVTAAQAIGGDIDVLVVGADCAAVAREAAQLATVSRVKVANAAHYAHQLAENVATLVVANAAGYTHIVAAATGNGKNLMPRVAALLDAAQVSDVVRVESADTFVHFIYAGNVMATVQATDAVKILTVRSTAFVPAGDGGSATLEEIAAAPDLQLSKVVSEDLVKSDRPELAGAKIVVSGGRGVGSGEKYRQLLEPLADKLGAALGASRAAVDAGYVPNDYQIGQTGKIVAPDLYIAVGISGAIQHLAGMKDSKVIVAINKDPDAPIFDYADYGLVADLFEAVPQLIQAL